MKPKTKDSFKVMTIDEWISKKHREYDNEIDKRRKALLEMYSRALSGSGLDESDFRPITINFSKELENNIQENAMKEEISIDFDFVGGIRKLDNHYLVKAGCHLFICDDLKEVSKRIKKALEESYKDET